MTELRLIITPEALQDLDGIWQYVANDASPVVASRLIGAILNSIALLQTAPGIGHRREDVRGPYQFWSVKRYMVAYRTDEAALFVVRVVHGHRDLRSIFQAG